MILRILGSSGSLTLKDNTTSFLLNDSILLDAGAAASALTLEEQLKLEYVFITHSHFDHIKDIPLLADNILGRNFPLKIHATEFVLNQIKEHLFNGTIWPDFTIIPDPEKPIVSMKSIAPGEEIELNGLRIKPFTVNHTVETLGFVIKENGSGFIFSGDTGVTDTVTKEANDFKGLKAIILETSFPNSERKLAELSRHLTPEALAETLIDLNNNEIPVYIFHIKPQYLSEVTRELNEIEGLKLKVLIPGEILQF